MPPRVHRVAALAAVAVLLLAAPVYAHLVLPVDQRESDRIVLGRPLGETVEGESVAVDHDRLSTWGDEHVVDLERLGDLAAANATAHLDCNEALGPTVDLLARAATEGRASTSDGEVAGTVQCLAAGHRYLALPGGNGSAYYSLAVDPSGDGVTVATTPVTATDVVATVREAETVGYDALTAAEQRTVDRAIEGGGPSYGGYVPPHGSSVVDRAPMLPERADGTYVVELVGWIDGVDLRRLLVVEGMQVDGAAALVAALWLTTRLRRGDD